MNYIRAEEGDGAVLNIYTKSGKNNPEYIIAQIEELSKTERTEIIKRINEYPAAGKE